MIKNRDCLTPKKTLWLWYSVSGYYILKLLMVAQSKQISKNGGYSMKKLHLSPESIAKYILLKAAEEGEPITQLKLQKLVYLSYVRSLINGLKLFDEPIEAWPNGPVVPSLYQALKSYGYNPIGQEYYMGVSQTIEDDLKEALPFLNEAFEEYVPKSAFELVALTHNDGAWSKIREGKQVTESSNDVISDDLILTAYAV